MRGVQISVAQKGKEVTVKDLKSPATNVARAIRYRLSHRQAGRFYAAIALAQIARSPELEKPRSAVAKSIASSIEPGFK